MRIRSALYGFKREDVKGAMAEIGQRHLRNKEKLTAEVDRLQDENKRFEEELARHRAAAETSTDVEKGGEGNG